MQKLRERIEREEDEDIKRELRKGNLSYNNRRLIRLLETDGSMQQIHQIEPRFWI
jgi:hypothetical protein